MNTVIDALVHYLFQALAAFAATVAFSILFSVPKRQYLTCGAVGALGWVVYCLFDVFASVTYATFAATIVVVLVSRLSAIPRRCPVTVLLIPGIIPLAPGSAIYYTAYYFFTGNNAYAADYLFLTFKVGTAIVLGIVIVFAINFNKQKKVSKIS